MRQEFEKAKIEVQNQIVESATTDKVAKKSKERKNAKHHQKKINHTNALSMIRNISIGLFLKGIVKEALNAFDKIVLKTTEIVRPNRKNPRNKKTKKLFHMNYKPL